MVYTKRLLHLSQLVLNMNQMGCTFAKKDGTQMDEIKRNHVHRICIAYTPFNLINVHIDSFFFSIMRPIAR